jgi:hypothetical protein
LNDKAKPRQMPRSAEVAVEDPAFIVLETLDAIASAMEMQATIAAARFVIEHADSCDDPVSDGAISASTSAAVCAALAYLAEPGENGDTPQ